MRKHILGLLFIYSMLHFSCKETGKSHSLASSAGAAADVLLICDRSIWSDLDQLVRDLVEQPFEGLPQVEGSFNLIYIEPDQFTPIFKSSHSIMRLVKDTINQITFNKNIWAQPQSLITIYGKTTSAIAKIFQENFQKVRSKLYDFHISRLQLLQSKQPSLIKLDRLSRLINRQKEKPFIPNTFRLSIDRNAFIWYRRDVPKGSQNLIFYRFSIPDELPSYLDGWLIQQRDRHIAQVRGQVPNSYMKTELNYPPYFTHKILKDDRLLVEVKGLWKLENDYMGGPFLSYFLIDFIKKEVLAFEGFVYAPSQKKRNMMLYMEALLKKNIYP